MQSPINYLCGGRMGDLMHVLLVIKSNYENLGRKGNLFISEGHGGEAFAHPINKVYEDVKELIDFQKYINSFSIYNGERVDVNLNSWRGSRHLFKKGWIDILCDTYKIQTSTNPWLEFSKVSDYEDFTIIHRSLNRNTSTFPWENIIEKEKCLFVTTNPVEADRFKSQFFTESVVVPSISELARIINSGKKFVGNMSSPLAIAHALGKHRLAELFHTDEVHYIGDSILPNFWYVKCGEKEIPSEF
jgi:hypothetical protein